MGVEGFRHLGFRGLGLGDHKCKVNWEILADHTCEEEKLPACNASGVQGFRGLGVYCLGFRGLGVYCLGFRGLGVYCLGFRGLGFGV